MSEANKSLAELMSQLQALERQIDEAEEITIDQCESHFSQIKDIDAKVDRLLAYMDLCKSNSALYSERSEELQKQSKFWERRLASLQNYALWLTNSYPEV